MSFRLEMELLPNVFGVPVLSACSLSGGMCIPKEAANGTGSESWQCGVGRKATVSPTSNYYFTVIVIIISSKSGGNVCMYVSTLGLGHD